MSDKILPRPVGAQIRALRLAKGWTLQKLAERAGTSAPTIHRYEGGWDRFELGTLRKIAAALEARLLVQLVPIETTAHDPVSSDRELVELLSPLFWDKPLTASDLAQYPSWVLRRVLTSGNRAQAAAVRARYGDDAILAAARHRSVDARTQRYWELMLRKEEPHASEGSQP